MMKFEYWQSDKNSNWYWRLRAGNGEIASDGGFQLVHDSRKTKHLPGTPNFRDSADAAVVLPVDHIVGLAVV